MGLWRGEAAPFQPLGVSGCPRYSRLQLLTKDKSSHFKCGCPRSLFSRSFRTSCPYFSAYRPQKWQQPQPSIAMIEGVDLAILAY